MLLLVFILPLINACSVVMFGTMGTNYDKKMNQGTSRNELHKLFGQPVSAFTYSTPLYPKDIPAVRDCFLYLDKSTPPQLREIKGREISGFEVFKINGVVRTVHADIAISVLLGDIATLGLSEIVFFPFTTYEWIKGNTTDKNMYIWYGNDNTFEIGKIEYNETHEFITFIPLNCNKYVSKRFEMQTIVGTSPREER